MRFEEGVKKLADIIDHSYEIVFFGGAGVSTESGIPDFRSADGIYNEKGFAVPPETVLSHGFFQRYPEKFYEFLRQYMIYPSAVPNPCHKYLAKLEREGKLFAVITQNIDELHKAAGSKTVYNLHGTLSSATCIRCGKRQGLSYLTETQGVPHCDCGGILKPDIVLYEEPLDANVWKLAENAVRDADCMIIGGTSLKVYPAAMLARSFQGKLVIINKENTGCEQNADLVLNFPIGETFRALAKLRGTEI